MPTEHDAHELLARAAATIDVDDAAPLTLTGLPEPHARRWSLLVAAAAAIVLVLGSGWLVATQLGTEDAAPRPANGPAVEHEHVYGPDQVPSLLGYTTAEARHLLQGRAVAVRLQRVHSCERPEGYVLGSTPGQGAALTSISSVTLSVTAGPGSRRCLARDPRGSRWARIIDLVRFARGLDGPPAFASEVSTFAGTQTASFDPEQAADPESWVVCDADACHSALAALVEEVTAPQYLRVGGPPPNRYLSPTIDLTGHAAHPGPINGIDLCGLTADPYERSDNDPRPSYLSFEAPMDGRPFLCPQIQVDWSADGAIAGVGLRLPTRPDPSPSPEVDPARQQAADAFVAWARGDGPAPDFAERVRHLNSGLAPAWNEEPERRDGWSGCSGLGFPECGIDPVASVERYDGKVVASPGRSTCPDDGTLPEPYASSGDVVRLSAPEPATCGTAWAVELWIDDQGQIYAVNQVGSTAPPGRHH